MTVGDAAGGHDEVAAAYERGMAFGIKTARHGAESTVEQLRQRLAETERLGDDLLDALLAVDAHLPLFAAPPTNAEERSKAQRVEQHYQQSVAARKAWLAWWSAHPAPAVVSSADAPEEQS